MSEYNQKVYAVFTISNGTPQFRRCYKKLSHAKSAVTQLDDGRWNRTKCQIFEYNIGEEIKK